MAAEAASFRTDIDSMSLGSTLSNDDSNPSMMTSGDESLSVPMPRTVIVPPSAPGLARGLGHLHARDLALQGQRYVGDRAVLEIAVETVDTAPVSFSLAGRAVADDHVDQHGEGVLFERDVGAGHGLRHLELLFLVAEIRYFDRLADTGRDGERAVRAGRRAGLPALDSYDDARDRVVLFVRDLSLDADLCAGLRMHGQEEEPASAVSHRRKWVR